MGCDIHAYVEYCNPELGAEGKPYWVSWGHRFNPGKNYLLFTLMAGVRGDPDAALFEPRGIPNPLGWTSQEDWLLDHSDCHTPSWLAVKEFKKVLRAYVHQTKKESRSGKPPPEYAALLAAMEALETWKYKVRLVFWFDS